MKSKYYQFFPCCSNLIQDYYSNNLNSDFGNNAPKIEDFKAQIFLKEKMFSSDKRATLKKVLMLQSEGVSNTHNKAFENIQLLLSNNTFTVTTGQQLNLFSGPLFFWYKIISTISLTRKLKAKYPQYNFIPLYWMATEDHDFEEINHFYFKGEKINWEYSSKDAFTGTIKTKSLEDTYHKFCNSLGLSSKASELKILFKKAYLEHDNLSQATRYLINHFFSTHGLLILDANEPELKKWAIPIFEKELKEGITYSAVMPQSLKLKSKGYSIQQEPSLCNLFYEHEGSRLKVIPEADGFKLGKSDIFITSEACLKSLKTQPEKFSPNVLLRPCYQELILPNLAYIGGPSELNYWFELKLLFEQLNIPVPILMLRNMAFLINPKQEEQLQKFNLHAIDLLGDVNLLINKYIKEQEPILEVQELEKQIKQQLEHLSNKYSRGMQEAIFNKQKELLSRLQQLEKRLISYKREQNSKVSNEIVQLKKSLYPFGVMQERVLNFSEIYLLSKTKIVSWLLNKLDPFKEEVLQIKI